MDIDHDLAEEEFKRAICQAERRNLYLRELDDQEDFITSSPHVYVQAIVAGKRSGLIPDLIDEDLFIGNWANVHNWDEGVGLPFSSRAKIKDLIRLCLFSVYGEAVSNGMKPDAFDVKLTQRMMNAIADVVEVNMDYFRTGEILKGSLEISKKITEMAELESGLKQKPRSRTSKV